VYVSVSGVTDVTGWFNAPHTEERILCFLVADTDRDRELLGTLFDNRGRISAKLGREVALFLFSPEPSPQGVIAKSDDPSNALLIPGLTRHKAGAEELSWKPIPVDSLLARDRDQVIRRTQRITLDLREYFDLDEETLPCLVFLARGEDTPFVVRTRDAADLKALEELFGELNRVGAILNTHDALRLPYWEAQTRSLVAGRDLASEDCAEARSFLDAAIPAARSALKGVGLDGLLDDLDADNARTVFDVLGMDRDPRRVGSYDPALLASVKAAMRDEGLRRQMRAIRDAGTRLRKSAARLAVLTVEMEKRLADRPNTDQLAATVHTVEGELDVICGRFERKVKWRRYTLPLKAFARFVARTAPVARDIASVTQGVTDMTTQLASRPRAG
jgi:hypothetical protein